MRTPDELGPEESQVVATAAVDTAIVDRPVSTWPPVRHLPSPRRSATLPSEPTRRLVGEVGDRLEVTGHVVVHGVVTAGAILQPGTRLDVEGSLDGPLVVRRGAVLSVHGTYRGDTVVNEGLVLVTGVASLESVRRRRVAVAYGSVLRGTHGESWAVDGAGRLRRLDGTTSLDLRMTSPDAARYCLWSDAAGGFLPVEDLPPVG